MAYVPQIGDVVITYAPFPLCRTGYYPLVNNYCHGIAGSNIGGHHLNCDNTFWRVYYHSQLVNPVTWANDSAVWLEAGNRYEIYRLGAWGNWSLALDFQENVYDQMIGRYRIPFSDWDYVLQYGCLPRIDNQRYPSQSWYEYFHINSFGYNKCYWYCNAQTFDSILIGWYDAAIDKQAVLDYCNQNTLSFFKNTLGGQVRNWLTSFQRVY